MTVTAPPALSAEARQAVVDAEISKAVRDGWAVQSTSAAQAVLTKTRRMSLWRNTLAVVLTSGLWLFYVVWRALNRKTTTMIVSVDAYGRVTRS